MADQRMEHAVQSLEKEVAQLRSSLSKKGPILTFKDYLRFIGASAEDVRNFTASSAPGTKITFQNLKAYLDTVTINCSNQVGLIEIRVNSVLRRRLFDKQDVTITFDCEVSGDLTITFIDGTTPEGTVAMSYFNLKNFELNKLLNVSEVNR